jgi:hypothetical protein
VHGEKGTPLSQRPVLTDAQWDVLLPRLDQMARRLRDPRPRTAYHHHMGTVIEARPRWTG